MTTLFLLFCGFSGYTAIFEAKAFLFSALCILYILSIVTIKLITKIKTKKLDLRFSLKSLCTVEIFAVLYALSSWLSAFLSPHFPHSFFGASRFEGAFTITLYCIIFIFVSRYGKAAPPLLYSLCLSVTVFGVICLLQLFGYNPLYLYPENFTFFDAGRLYPSAFLGTIGNTNLVGAFLSIVIPIFAFAVIKGSRIQKLSCITPLVLCLFIAAKMNCSSLLLALFFAFLCAVGLLFKQSKKALFIYLSILFISTAVFVIILLCIEPENQTLFDLKQLLCGNFDDSLGSGRLYIWKNVLAEIPERLFLGKGPDTMIFESFTPFSRYYPDLKRQLSVSIDVAHNECLNVLYHQGITGLILYLAIFILCIKASVQASKSSPIAAALGICAVCYFVQSCFTFSMCLTAPYFWICLALIISHSKQK